MWVEGNASGRERARSARPGEAAARGHRAVRVDATDVRVGGMRTERGVGGLCGRDSCVGCLSAGRHSMLDDRSISERNAWARPLRLDGTGRAGCCVSGIVDVGRGVG